MEKSFGGRYRLLSELGRGGGGAVYEAEHLWTGRHVALKILRGRQAVDGARARRFLREARSAASLLHPNVVQIYDVGLDDASGDLYIVQELLRGEDLEARLASGGKLELPAALEILLPVMDALVVAHDAGIVHRDVKPSNIFVSVDPTTGAHVPKLIDFGLAKRPDQDQLMLTMSGETVGTPAYMSPEQVTGGAIDARTDVWSMGVVLFEVLSGALPFDGSSVLLIANEVMNGALPDMRAALPDAPPVVRVLLSSCFERDVKRRLPAMAQLVRALCGAIGAPFPHATAEQMTLGEALPAIDVPLDEEWSAPPPGAARLDALAQTMGGGQAMSVAQAAMADDDPTLIGPAPSFDFAADAPAPLSRTTRPRAAARLRFGLAGATRDLEDPRMVDLLSRALGIPVAPIRYQDYASLVAAIAKEEVEFAWLAPVAYALAAEREVAFGIATVERSRHASYAGALLTSSEAIRSLDNLVGARAAWVDPWSAAGYVVPRWELRALDLDLDALTSEQVFLGSHEAVIDALQHERADIGASYCLLSPQGTLVRAGWPQDSGIRTLHITAPIPSEVLAVACTLDTDLREALGIRLRGVMREPDAKELLASVGVSGLSPCVHAEYERLALAAPTGALEV